MSIKAINEAFDKMYSGNNLNESTKSLIEDVSPELKDLASALFKTLTRLENSGETDIKKYEAAFQDTIEEQFPEKSWWEVTDCDIFSDLFETRDPQKTVINIISKAKSDLTECDRGTQRVLEALRRIANKLTEAPMSDEDRRDSDLIRSAYDKIQKRSNARLTPEEQAVLNKYGIKRGYNKNLEYDSGKNYTRDDVNIVNNQDDKYSHGRDVDRWDRKRRTWVSTKDPSKINYADRARKRPEREKNRTYDYTYNDKRWGNDTDMARDERGIIDYNLKPGTDERGRNYGVDQNTAINRMSQTKLAKMRGALGDRKSAQIDLDNAQARFDKRKADADASYMKRMQDAEKQYDWSMSYANDEFKRDSDPSKKNKAQAEIDSLLKRNKTEALDTKSTRELINRVRSCRDLDSALEMVYYSILVGNGMPADIIKSGAKRVNLSKIPGTMTKALEDDTSWKKASTPDEVADRIENILSKVERPSKKKAESLKEAWSANDLYSDIYNALADVMFKWHNAGYDLDVSQVDSAYEWFATHFWEDEDFED